MKLVSKSDIDDVFEDLEDYNWFGVDTETTGLDEDDYPFLLILAHQHETYLFNFFNYEGLDKKYVLDATLDLASRFSHLFKRESTKAFIHNAKFDMRMLSKLGVSFDKVHCVYAAERVIRNNRLSYSLDALAKQYFPDFLKDDTVKEYITKNKLFTWVDIPGKKKRDKRMHFECVPYDIMFPYAVRDAELHLKIGLKQLDILNESDKSGLPSLIPLYRNEVRLTTTCFNMERRGVMIDKAYTAKAMLFETDKLNEAKREFETSTGRSFVDSGKVFADIFSSQGVDYPKTEKGNPSFKADVLELITHPLARTIENIREHEKRVGTYYSSFLHLERNGRIRPTMNQAGTESGRFSYMNPNLQNIPKEDFDGLTHYVRKCFIPTPGFTLYSIDYQQQEFRLMLDYAGDKKLINSINNGADVHQATADMIGISRNQAKTINFGLLYGMGIEKLAKDLGVTVREAREIKLDYFGKLPLVERFIRSVTKTGEARGFIYNWMGRRCYIEKKEWAYILPNHLIQGSGADVIKVAMNRIEDFLKYYESRMILQVHDELVFEIKKGEEEIVESIKKIMEDVYQPRNGMKLTCSTEFSTVSWGHPDKGV